MEGNRPQPAPSPELIIRMRQRDDAARCVDVLATMHTADGYPLLWPADPPAWLTPMNLLSAY
jgi:hypothetical protein